MSERIEPMSFNQFEAETGGDVAAFTLYCLRYYVQQNQDRLSAKELAKYREALDVQD